jgi:hypothetical protein
MRMRALLKKFRLLEWGGDYKNFFDPMHVVIKNPSEPEVIKEMRALGITPTGRFKNIVK